MSTSYYKLAEPITKIVKTEIENGLMELDIWTRGKCNGRFTQLEDLDAIEIIEMLCDKQTNPVVQTYWGGSFRGCCVREYVAHLNDNDCLVSEYGEIVTVAEVRAKDGEGKNKK